MINIPASPPPAVGVHSSLRDAVEALDSQHQALLSRVRSEYYEMPGLSLTLRQAQRLWSLRRIECETVLDELVDSGFLARTSLGMFVRAGSGRAGA